MILVHARRYTSPLLFSKAKQLCGVLLWGIQISPILVLKKVRHSTSVPLLLRVAQQRGCLSRSAVEGVPLLVEMIKSIPLLVIGLVGFHHGQSSRLVVRFCVFENGFVCP